MNQKIKEFIKKRYKFIGDNFYKIFALLIVLAILAVAIVYIWDTVEKRAYFERENQIKEEQKHKACLEKCDEKYLSTLYIPVQDRNEYRICALACGEKYGIFIDVPNIEIPSIKF